MDCERVRELEGAYALDALDAADTAAVREHLATCDQHGDMAELQSVATGLALASEERQPPQRLRERVLDSAAESRAPVAHGERRRWTRGWLAAAAAVVLVIAVGSVAALFAVTGNGGDPGYVHEFTAEGELSVRVETELGEPDTRVAFSGMPELDEGEEYRLWAIRGEDWLSIGTFEPNAEGEWAGDFEFALQEGDSLCLTVQRPADPSGPFGDPVFIEPL